MRRRNMRRPTDHVEPDLPITPMLDMSFQLLAFFVVTYDPGPIEGMIPLALPKLDAGPPALSLPTDPEGEEVTVQVTATEAGGIDGISVITKATAANPTTLGKDPKALGDHLKAFLAAAKGQPPGKLTVEMADELNYQFTITLLDVCRRAGYERPSPAPLNRKGK